MRLSLFALFFALPAAYAAVSPLKQTIRSEDFCLPDATCTISTEDTDCCTSITGLQCYTPSGSDSGVCPIAHLLLFTLVTELNAVLLGITADIGRCRKGDSGMVQVTVMLGSYAFRASLGFSLVVLTPGHCSWRYMFALCSLNR